MHGSPDATLGLPKLAPCFHGNMIRQRNLELFLLRTMDIGLSSFITNDPGNDNGSWLADFRFHLVIWAPSVVICLPPSYCPPG